MIAKYVVNNIQIVPTQLSPNHMHITEVSQHCLRCEEGGKLPLIGGLDLRLQLRISCI